MLSASEGAGQRDASPSPGKRSPTSTPSRPRADDDTGPVAGGEDAASLLRRENERLRQQLRHSQCHGPGPSHSQTLGGGGGGSVSRAQTAPGALGVSAGSRLQRAKDFEALREQLRAFESRIAIEERRLEDLTSRTEDVKERVAQARQAMGGIRVTKENTALVERQIHVLEGRLEKSLVKFNESLRVNRELRAEIDTLRRERSVFDGIYRRLERELQAKKREMAFLIEVANVAFEERDQSQTELAQLKVYAAKELQAFDETFRELDGLLEEDRKMKDAIRGRIAERTQPPPPGLSRTLGDTTRTTIEIDMSTKSRTVHLPTIKLAGATVAQGALQSASAGPAGATEMSAAQYEEAFAQLRAATNVADIGLLVQRYLRSEDENFSLFNYVNTLRRDIEKLEATRAEVHAELTRLQGAAVGLADAGRRAKLKELEERLQTGEAQTKRYDLLAAGPTATLEDVMLCVEKMFVDLECDEQPIVAAQGVTGMSENSLRLYLAALEAQADASLVRWQRAQGTFGVSQPSPAARSPAAPLPPDIPSVGDDGHEGAPGEDDDRVLTRGELVARTTQKLARQQQQTEGRKGGKRPVRRK